MVKALVTGGAGFVGSHLCDACIAAGDQTIALDNLSTGSPGNLSSEVRLIEADVCNGERISRILEECAPEVIYHLAAQASVIDSLRDPVSDMRTNASGTLTLLEAARRLDPFPRFVYASTGGAGYGDAKVLPVPESCPTEFRSPYATSKHVGEAYVSLYARLHDLPTSSLRLSNVYGPRQRGDLEAGVVSIFARQLTEGEPVILYGEGKAARDYLFVGDAAQAFRMSATHVCDGSAYNVGTGVATEVEKILELVGRALGHEPARVERRPIRSGEVFRNSLDATLFQEITGWEPRHSLQEGIALFARWFADTHPSR